MSFIQIINFKTDRIDEVVELRTEWLNQSAGNRTAQELRMGTDRDVDRSYYAIVEFPTYEEAMENSNLPATQQFAEQMTKLCTEPPQYINLDVLEEESFINRK